MKILFALSSYLLGAIPAGYLIFRLSENKDIRNFGSGSTGATNVFRLKGWKFALPIIVFDILKGFIPAYMALQLFHDKPLALICAFFAVLGHCYPLYIKFRGGKGLATTAGACAALAFKPLLPCIVIFVAIIILTRYVSLGSMLAALCYPFFVLLFTGELETAILGFALFFLITLRHHSNIGRLIKGKERKLGDRA